MENIYDIEICPDLDSDEKKINIDCKMMIILLMFLIQYQLENCCFNWL